MPYRYQGRAYTDPNNPSASAICDRCGFRYNLSHLKFQYQWAGTELINQNILVCSECYDVPQEQLRAIILPPDPQPVLNARPERYDYANTSWIAEEGTYGDIIMEESDGPLLVTETGIVSTIGGAVDLTASDGTQLTGDDGITWLTGIYGGG